MRGRLQRLARPEWLFVILSLAFGLPAVALNPPLRGPDEAAHFLRAYGLGGGELIAQADGQGRRGLFLPAGLHADYAIFADAQRRFGAGGFTYREVFAEFGERDRPGGRAPPVFVHYEGSEGYSPAAYLPHLAAASAARLLGLGFLPAFYAMRLAGLLVMTGVAAYAIARIERLKWALFLIGLLPAALYGRTVISADGGALAFAMAITAVTFNGVRGSVAGPGHRAGGGALERSLWMTLAILSKPPQIVFVALEPMTTRLRDLARNWRTVLLVVGPGLILLPLWLIAVSGDMAAWRMIEAMGMDPELFSPTRKALFLLENPLHFPRLMGATILESAGMHWRQLIGVLGWLDTPLPGPVYPLLTGLLAITCIDRLDVTGEARARVILYGLLVLVGYTACLYLIFYLTWTPLDAPLIWGPQGRYFLVILPVAALVLAAALDRRLPVRVTVAAALAGATLGGTAMLAALAGRNW
jgi:uncharacterized membrane protein